MPDYTDAELSELVFRAIVPKGLRPETPEEIDAMLDAIGSEVPSEESVQRMLRKVRGEEPLAEPCGETGSGDSRMGSVELPETEAALYRNREDEIPPEVERMLQEMENEALEDGEEWESEADSHDA